MHRALIDAIIFDTLERDPERLSDAIANVADSLAESGRYSWEQIDAAIRELLNELEEPRQTRH